MAKKLTEQQRLAIVGKWRASGLSIPKFAAKHGNQHFQSEILGSQKPMEQRKTG